MAYDGYTPTGTYNDNGLSSSDRAIVNSFKQQWDSAYKAGDQAGMDAAHAGAESVRAQYGYSGGADGSGYYFTQMSEPMYYGSQLSSARSADTYINALIAAQQEATLNELKSAYDQNVLTLNAVGEKIPLQYQDARNLTASNSELRRAAFNEAAAKSGLNSGAGSQASLAIGNTLQNNLSGLSRAEADSLADLELERSRLETAYKNDVAQAISNGELAKAQALYNEYVRVDNSLVETSRAQASEDYTSWAARTSIYDKHDGIQQQYAQMLAALGDFSGYLALGLSPLQVTQLQDAYTAAMMK